MSALLGIGGILGAIISLVIIGIKAIKKQPKKNAVIAFVVCFVLFAVGFVMPSDSNPNKEPTTQTKTTETTTKQTSDNTTEPEQESIQESTSKPTLEYTPEPFSFVLMDEPGEYGEEVILDKGTEFEEVEIIYHIPAGIYDVTNLNPRVGVQVTVCCGGQVGPGEGFATDENCARPIVMLPNETKELEIKEGQFVILSDYSDNIRFIAK